MRNGDAEMGTAQEKRKPRKKLRVPDVILTVLAAVMLVLLFLRLAGVRIYMMASSVFSLPREKVQLRFVRKDRPTAFVIKTNTPPGERQFLPADRAGYFVLWGFSPTGREVSGVF